MASATAPPTTPKTTTSVDPLYTQAVAQAQAALAAQQAPVQSEQQASDSYYAQRQQDATDNAAAVSDLLKGIGPNISSAYTSAAQNDSLLANGFSAGMQDALKGNAENLNGILSKLGLPANINSKASSTGDVLQGLGGYIPGKALDKSGAAFTAAADLLPATALLKGEDTSKQLAIEGGKAHTALDSKLAEMAGNLPGDIQANYSKLQSLALENKKFAETVSNDKFNQAYKIAQQKLASAKYKTSVDEFNSKQALATAKYKTSISEFNANYSIKVANQKIAAQRLSIEATKAANSQYNSDRNYQLALGRLGVSQKNLQLRITAAAFKAANGGYTQAQMTKLETQTLGFAEQALNGTTRTRITGSSTTPTVSSVKGVGRMSYGDAMTAMLKKGWPVQIVLKSLDQVYGKPDASQEAEIETALGPLTPTALAAQVVNNAGFNNQINNEFSGGNVSFASGKRIPTAQLPTLAEQALKIAAPTFATQANIQALVGRIMQESGGNAGAINLWDSNAKAGHPSKGVLQTIDSTFNKYKLPGHEDIWNPLDNAIAAVRYMIADYGHIVGPSNSGY